MAAVEPDNGRLVLDTDEGPISMRLDPSELRGIEVGDTVRVSFVTGDDDDSSE